jgi:hypothetical protein
MTDAAPAQGATRRDFIKYTAAAIAATRFEPYQPGVTLESVKQRAAQLNANGRIAQKFGMKILVHNHTGEFEKLTDSPMTTYEVLLAQIDFKPVFANAPLAGLKHFALEHDNAASWGDSLAAARVSHQNIVRMLS